MKTITPDLLYGPAGGGLSPAEIRQRLELKAAAVVTTERGFAKFPPRIDEIKNPKLRALVACGMVLKNWTCRDLTECAGLLGEVASSVLMETLDKPQWGRNDLALLRLVARIENLSITAWRGVFQ